MKKIRSLLAVLLVAVLLCSCTSIESIIEEFIASDDVDSTQPYAATEYIAEPYVFPNPPAGFTQVDAKQYIGYSHLTDTQKSVYVKMLQAAQRMNDQSFSVGECSEGDVSIAYQALKYDWPQLIWLTLTYGISDMGGTMYVCFSNQEGDYTYLFATEQERNDALAQMYGVIDQFIAENITADMSAFDIELKVHDWLCNTVEYDDEAAESLKNDSGYSGRENAWTPYGALVEHRAVCAGYAQALQLVLNYVGIECVSVRAESQDEMHLLDMVNIDGAWVYTDPTWDDGDTDMMGCTHAYFNLTYDQIKITHNIFDTVSPDMIITNDSDSRFNVFLPVSDNAQYGYYTVTGKSVDSADRFRTVVLREFRNASLNGIDSIEIKITYCQPDYDTVERLLSNNRVARSLESYYGRLKNMEYLVLDNGVVYMKVNKKQ